MKRQPVNIERKRTLELRSGEGTTHLALSADLSPPELLPMLDSGVAVNLLPLGSESSVLGHLRQGVKLGCVWNILTLGRTIDEKGGVVAIFVL